ncbi:hypothetical protein GIB67_032850, partial [Kingdonia uniflora]
TAATNRQIPANNSYQNWFIRTTVIIRTALALAAGRTDHNNTGSFRQAVEEQHRQRSFYSDKHEVSPAAVQFVFRASRRRKNGLYFQAVARKNQHRYSAYNKERERGCDCSRRGSHSL